MGAVSSTTWESNPGLATRRSQVGSSTARRRVVGPATELALWCQSPIGGYYLNAYVTGLLRFFIVSTSERLTRERKSIFSTEAEY